jgi:peptidoglycan/LPS O-acetylase OafA/YrhL
VFSWFDRVHLMNDNQSRHLAQLDGLRALAVFVVLIDHSHPRDYLLDLNVPWGEMGVNLFFVLSGFLITGILLRCRQLVEQGTRTVAGALGSFYARRFLRIFPLFYATLLVLALCDYRDIRASLGWHFSYLSNVSFVISHSGRGYPHFWSLAVEEQFYLVWPCLVLFTPRRLLMPLVLAGIAIGPLFRLGVALVWPDNLLARIWLPFACFDTLGAGALLALISSRSHPYRSWRKPALRLGLWLGGPLLAVFLVLCAGHWFPRGMEVVLFRCAMGLFFFWLTARAAEGFSGWFGRLLVSRPLTYVGKISYGIYVIHYFIPVLTVWALSRVGLSYPSDEALGRPLAIAFQFVLHTAVTVVLASASWYLFEKPLNDLKRYFPYEGRPARETEAPLRERPLAEGIAAGGDGRNGSPREAGDVAVGEL